MNQPIAARGAEKQHSTFSSRATHWLQHHQREAKDSFGRLAQAPLSTLMTVLVMTIALTLPLALGKLLDDNRITFMSSEPAIWKLALKRLKFDMHCVVLCIANQRGVAFVVSTTMTI